MATTATSAASASRRATSSPLSPSGTRRGADEIVFPNCGEFPLPLRRCRTR